MCGKWWQDSQSLVTSFPAKHCHRLTMSCLPAPLSCIEYSLSIFLFHFIVIMLRYLKRISWFLLLGYYELKMCYLGVLYHRWKKYDKAERLYQKALEINPKLQSAKDNMVLLHKAQNRMANQQWCITSISPLQSGKLFYETGCHSDQFGQPDEYCHYFVLSCTCEVRKLGSTFPLL